MARYSRDVPSGTKSMKLNEATASSNAISLGFWTNLNPHAKPTTVEPVVVADVLLDVMWRVQSAVPDFGADWIVQDMEKRERAIRT